MFPQRQWGTFKSCGYYCITICQKNKLDRSAAIFIGQLSGAMAGSLLVWLAYLQHYKATENAALILATFATSPAINSSKYNFLTEFLAPFVFVFAILFIVAPSNSLGALDALPVALFVFGIGLSFGGPTGYAINPVRDLGPRIIISYCPFRIRVTVSGNMRGFRFSEPLFRWPFCCGCFWMDT